MGSPSMIPTSRTEPLLQAGGALSAEDAEALLEKDLSSGTGHTFKFRDLMRMHFSAFLDEYQIPPEKLKVMNAILNCKTGSLGYTLARCEGCNRIEMHACACGNRHCPSCGYLAEQKWVAVQQADVIPSISYFHMVFTLPHLLNPVIYQNQKAVLNLLFRSVKDTILELSDKNLGIIPGFTMVLHTFGSRMNLHYHLHVLVSGGGLSKDKSRFIQCPVREFFLPAKAVAKKYRGKFMDGLKQLMDSGRLVFHRSAKKYRNRYEWKELLNCCYGTDWNVEIKHLAPLSASRACDPTAENAVSYFARYTNRTAISDSRILWFDEKAVCFKYKEYDGDSYTWKEETLPPSKFIRRFLAHILPAGFQRVRHGGFLAGCVRRKNLLKIHELLCLEYHPSPILKMNSAELIRSLFGKDPGICPVCHCRMKIFPRERRPEDIHLIRAG